MKIILNNSTIIVRTKQKRTDLSNAVVGSVVYADKSYTLPEEEVDGEPIGVVVIPPYLNGGHPVIMSLGYVAEDGSATSTAINMPFGDVGDIEGYPHQAHPLNELGVVRNTVYYSVDVEINSSFKMADDGRYYYGTPSTSDRNHVYDGDNIFENYGLGIHIGENVAGIELTNLIKNATDVSMPINAVANYETIGTTKGEWYLPSNGELPFLGEKWSVIQATLQSIKNKGFNAALLDSCDDLLTSRTAGIHQGSLRVWQFSMKKLSYGGTVYASLYTKPAAVRAFLVV